MVRNLLFLCSLFFSTIAYATEPIFVSARFTSTTEVTVTFTQTLTAVNGLPGTNLLTGFTVTGQSISGTDLILTISPATSSVNFTCAACLTIPAAKVENGGDGNVAIGPVAVSDGIFPTQPVAPTAAAGPDINALEGVGFPVRASIAGTGALAGDVVSLLLGGAPFGTPQNHTLIAGDITNGYYDFTITTALLGADGAKVLTSRVTDVNTNVGPESPALNLTLDTDPPTINIVGPSASLANNSSMVTYTINYTGATAVTLANGNITINQTGGAGASHNVTGAGTSTRTVTLSSFTGNGTVGISIAAGTATDAAGNPSPAAGPSSTITVDNMAPTAAPTPTNTGGSTINISENGTFSVIVGALGGTGAVAGDILEILVNGSPFAAPRTQVLTGGQVTSGFTFTNVTLPGPDGTKNITARVTDQIGNVGAPSAVPLVLTLDATAPTAPSTPTAADGPLINALENSNFTVNVGGLGATGAAVGDVLELRVNGAAFAAPRTHVLTAGDIATGFDFTSVILPAPDGVKNITARVTDQAGNVGASSTQLALTLDTTPPTINIVGPSVSIANNAAVVTYTINYTGAAAVTLVNGNITINSTGGAGASHNVTGAGLSTRTVTLTSFTGDGTVGISIASGTATDAAGNPSPGAGPSSTITVDNMPPALPGVPNLTSGTDSQGVANGRSGSNSDNITNSTNPTFTGSGINGHDVLIFSDLLGQIGVGTVSGGNYNIGVGAIIEGTHIITARQRDPAGNLSGITGALTPSLVIDRTPPAILGIPSFSADNPEGPNTDREVIRISFTENIDMGNGVDAAHNNSTETGRDGFIPSEGNIANNNSYFDAALDQVKFASVSNNQWSSSTTFTYYNTADQPSNAADQHPNYIHDIAGNEMLTVSFGVGDTQPVALESGFVFYPNSTGPETIVFNVNEELILANGASVTGFSTTPPGIATAVYSGKGVSNTITLTAVAEGTWTEGVLISYDQATGNVLDLTGAPANELPSFLNEPIRFQGVTISSNNANGFPQRANNGDIVTLAFTTAVTPSEAPIAIFDTDTGNPSTAVETVPLSNNWTASYTITGVNNDGPLAFLLYMKTASDSTATSSTTIPLPTSTIVTVDRTSPAITPVTIASNNANPSFGIPGNIVTISFSVNEPLFGSPVVTLDGKPTLVAGGPLVWTATATLDGTYTEGAPLTFNIALQDEVGNPAVATATTNASSVTFDNTPPTVSMIDISSGLNGIGATNGYTPPPNSVSFLVTFSEPNVSGVDASDFQIVTGNFGGDISFPLVSATGLPPITVSAVTGSTATVTLNGITGTGWIRINLIDNNTIRDPAGNLLGGPVLGAGTFITSFTGNDYYTVALPEPSNPVINPLVARFSTNFGVAWNDGGGAQLATNYLVIVKRTSVPSFPAINDGTFVPDDGNLADGILIQNVPFGTTSHLFTGVGLVDNFDAIIYPYTLSANNTTDNINFGTPVSVYSSADIRKNPGFNYSGTVNIPYINHQATDIINSGTSIVLEEFELRDGAGAADPDNLPTELTALTLEVTNYQNLRQIALFDGGTQIKELPASSIVNTGPSVGQITFNSFDNPFVAADDGNRTLSIRVSFLGNGVTDNDIITFRVVNVTAASTNSSQFLNTTPVGIQSTPTADQNKIEVTATKLDYVSIPLGGTSAFISANFNVIVHARDAAPFDNLDLDFNANVSSITNAGTLLTSPTPATSGAFAAGVKNFTFQYLTEGNGTLTMSTTGPTISSQVSPPINVVASSESRLYTDNSGLLPTIDYINHQQGSNPSTYTLARLVLSDGDADGFPGDSDLAPTVLTDLDVTISNPTFIKRIALYNAAGTLIGGTDQNGGSGTISFNGLSITAPDDGTTFFTIRASFENTTVIDETNIQLTVSAATDGVGSNFLPGAGLIGGVNVAARQTPAVGANIVDVVATRLDFTTQPDTYSGINEPFSAFPPVPIVEARDVHQRLDLGHDFVANVSAPGANLSPSAFNFVDGILNFQSVNYTSPGNGTITVTSNGLSSNSGGSTPSSNVEVIHVSTSIATGGVNGGNNLAGGSVNKVIFGVTFNTPYTVGAQPKLNEFTFTFSNSITGVFTNIRVFESQITAYSGGTATNVTSPGIGATLTAGPTSLRVNFAGGTPRDLSAPANSTLTYFLMVDVDPTANGSTPPIQPSLLDDGYPAANNGNIVISNGSTTSSVIGQNYSFAAIFPPGLVSSNPATGQLNVDPNKPTIDLVFTVPVWTLDNKITLHDQTNPSNPPVVLNALAGQYAPPPPNPTFGTQALPLQFDLTPIGGLAQNNVYYITIEPGNFDNAVPANSTGIMDQAGNLFPGISYSGTLYFKTANPNPPILLKSNTPGAIPGTTDASVTDVTVNGATINATFSQKGKAYYAVLSGGSGAPTNAQILGAPNPPGFVTRGSFDINQEQPISQFGIISASLATSTTYDVWIFAENDALPTPFATAFPYGSSANDHVVGAGGPTLSFTTPPSGGSSIGFNNPSINICSNSFQPFNKPIIISEGNTSNFNSGPGVVTFNLVLPGGFQFDISKSGGNPVFGKLTLVGSDFPASQPNPSLEFVGASILRVSYINNGSSSSDQIILSDFRIIAPSTTSGNIVRLGGSALTTGIPDLTSVGTLSSSDAPAITFTNSFSEAEFFGQPTVTFIPDNFNPPSLTVELIPQPPAGDFGPTAFSGQGVNINQLNLPAVTLDQPFLISILHTDNNGCSSQTVEQYTVYDHNTAIAIEGTPAPYCAVNDNFVVNQNNRPPNSPYPVAYEHNIRHNNINAFRLLDLSADLLPVPPTSHIIKGPAWRTLVQSNSFLVQGASFTEPGVPGTFYDYSFNEATIVDANFLSSNVIPDPYSNFRFGPTSQNNFYYSGGLLGTVVLTGEFQSVANAALQIPLKQNIDFWAPAVPIVEIGQANQSFLDMMDPLNPPFDPLNPIVTIGPSNKGTPVFCEAGGPIVINGFPAAAAGASVGTFTLEDVATNTPISTGALVDNSNGTATLDPSLFTNSYQDIRIIYTFQEDGSPCESTGSQVIRISPNPIADFTQASIIDNNTPTGAEFCEDRKIIFDGSLSRFGSAGNGNTIIEKFQWDFADATNASGGNPNNIGGNQNDPEPAGGTFEQPHHTFVQSARYGVSLTVRSNIGCASVPFVGNVDVGAIPVVDFDFRGVSIAEPTDFVDNTTLNSAGTITDGIQQLDWSFGDSNVGTASPVSHTYGSAGKFDVTLTATSIIGCVADLTQQIVMVEKVTPTELVAYLETFESSDGNWQVLKEDGHPSTASWAWGAPTTSVITNPLNGSNIWTTNLSGPPSPSERSYLYTTCFDMTQLERPMISFNSMVQLGTGDGVVIEFSTDNRNIADPDKNWDILGSFEASVPSGVDWYNALGLPSKPGDQTSGDYGWSGSNISEWLESKHILDAIDDPATPGGPLTPINNVVFRFGIASLNQNPQLDGFAIDNIRIGNRTRTILVENFTNKGNPASGPGGVSREKIESDNLKTLNPGAIGTELVKINYHVGFPGLDPFNLDNPADPSARALFYNITETPLTRLDGNKNDGPNEAFYSTWGDEQYNIRTLQLAQADLVVTPTNNPDGSLQIDVSVDPKVELPANTVLHVAILEKDIAASSLNPDQASLIATGESDFEYVLKRMLPNALGSRFNAIAPAGQVLNFGPFNWYPEKLKLYSPANDIVVIAFLQNEDTKEILQSEIVEDVNDPPLVTGLDFESIADRIAIFPNPADGEVTVQLPTPAVNRIELQMVDQMGRVVNRSAIEVGEESTEIYTRDMAAGIYLLQFGSGNSNTFKKVMVVHK